MPTWLSIVLSLGGSTFCGLAVSALWHVLEKRYQNANKYTHNQELKQIKSLITEKIDPIRTDIKNIQERMIESKQTEILGLRCEMLDIYHRCKAQGYAEESDRVTFDELHNRYNKLGGNHYIDFLNTIRYEIFELPRVSQEDKEN